MNTEWKTSSINSKLADEFVQKLSINPLIAELLIRRGFKSFSEALDFLNPSYAHLHSPFLMTNMYDALALLRQKIDAKSKIGIFADSDLDGLTSLYIVRHLLTKMNLDIFHYYPNDEHSDYGLSVDVVNLFLKEKVELLITLDCGITDVEPIALLKQSGVDVLVCDHHEPDNILPDAIIVNPKQKQCGYPFKSLAGVGVAFKLCQALLYSYLPTYGAKCCLLVKDQEQFYLRFLVDGVELVEERVSFFYIEEAHRFITEDDFLFYYNISDKDIESTPAKKNHKIEDLVAQAYGSSAIPSKFRESFALYASSEQTVSDAIFLIFKEALFNIPAKVRDYISDVMPFVAIGTIADVMPLKDENRVLASKGVELFNSHQCPSLMQLREFCKSEINAKTIGWQVAPLLNSPGRFGRTVLTADFFLSTADRCADLFKEISELNEYRKKYVKDIFLQIIRSSSDLFDDSAIVFAKCEGVEEGITGLLASKLADRFHKPAIVVIPIADGLYKGSGRSPYQGLMSLIKPHAALFQRFGGHDQALGFTIEEQRLDELEVIIQKLPVDLLKNQKIHHIDLEIDITDVSISLIRCLETFEPYGAENPHPLCLSKSVQFSGFKAFGRNAEHGKLILDNKSVEIISWDGALRLKELYDAKRADILYTMELNSYWGAESIRLMLIDAKIV